MSHAVRMEKFREFNPETSKWRCDKRNYEQATEAMGVMVAKNYAKLALPCVAIYPEMRQGHFAGLKVAAPDGPLKDYFDKVEIKEIFFGLIQDAVIDALAKKEERRKGNEVISSAKIVPVVAFREPPRPIWLLTSRELEAYFSEMKSQLATVDGVKIQRKWPKIIDGKAAALPTRLPSLDEVCEKILPSDVFIPAKKFPLGNLQWRLKLICAYLMLKFDRNPDILH